jgi:rhodanese-related sulfurtransferase
MASPPTVERISAEEAARRLAEAQDPAGSGPLLVDVREADEYAQFRADGAVLLPLSGFQLSYVRLPQDRPLLLICASGQRSLVAGEFLVQRGYGAVANVEGGTLAWARAQLPLRTGQPDPGEGELPG